MIKGISSRAINYLYDSNISKLSCIKLSYNLSVKPSYYKLNDSDSTGFQVLSATLSISFP